MSPARRLARPELPQSGSALRRPQHREKNLPPRRRQTAQQTVPQTATRTLTIVKGSVLSWVSGVATATHSWKAVTKPVAFLHSAGSVGLPFLQHALPSPHQTPC